MVACEVDGVDDVGCAGALHDQRRPAIDQPVPDRPCIVVTGIAGLQDGPANTHREGLNGLRVERRLGGGRACHSILLS